MHDFLLQSHSHNHRMEISRIIKSFRAMPTDHDAGGETSSVWVSAWVHQCHGHGSAGVEWCTVVLAYCGRVVAGPTCVQAPEPGGRPVLVHDGGMGPTTVRAALPGVL